MMASAPIPDGIDGRSLTSLLKGTDTGAWERDLFFHRREGGAAYGGLVINGMIRGPWKLLQNTPFSSQELYQLEDDPLENEDRMTKAGKVRNELQAALRKHIQRGGAVPWQPPATANKADVPRR